MTSNAQRINQDSGDCEYYTPQPVVEAARLALGRIDLDPASSKAANIRVKAHRWFGIGDDALRRPWYGSVWLNHPFSREGNPLWVSKLVVEYLAGNTTSACCITFAATSEKWFQPLLAFPQCFLSPRTNYYLPDGSLKRGVTKGSVVTYMGADLHAFAKAFTSLGVLKIPYTGAQP